MRPRCFTRGTCFVLCGAYPLYTLVERGGHLLTHGRRIVALRNKRYPAVSPQPMCEFLFGDA